MVYGTDPLKPDTDSDGILDGDEKFYQTYTHIVENEDCVVSEVIVSLEGTGNLQKNTTVKSVMNKDVLCTNVAGLVGEPFNIETSSQFDTATITFKIDKSKLGDTEFDNLMFLWYDEENNEFVELETVLDEPNSTVSVVTTHFSKYMIVDRQAWYDAWALEFNYERKYDNSGAPLRIYNTVLAIDCSGSMSDYDRNGTIRKEAATGFINIMNPNDKTALMFFDSTVDGFHVLTSDKDALLGLLDKRIYTFGGTDYNVELRSQYAVLDGINEMLDDDIPAMLAIGPYCTEYVFLFDSIEDIKSGTYSHETKGHYVTVTATYYDDIANDYYLEISSWGEKYYISYRDFTDKKDVYSGETRISL